MFRLLILSVLSGENFGLSKNRHSREFLVGTRKQSQLTVLVNFLIFFTLWHTWRRREKKKIQRKISYIFDILAFLLLLRLILNKIFFLDKRFFYLFDFKFYFKKRNRDIKSLIKMYEFIKVSPSIDLHVCLGMYKDILMIHL